MSDLSERAARLYDSHDNEALFELATEAWSDDLSRLPEGVAAACRYASMRAHENRHPDDADLFYARALVASMLAEDRTTMAGLLLKIYFRSLAVARDRRLGRDAYRKARQITDLIAALLPAEARGELVARLFHEARACAPLYEATGGGGAPTAGGEAIMSEARECFETSLEFERSPRGELRVAGSLALVDYLLSAYESDPERRASAQSDALERTKEIFERAAKSGLDDVANWARTNARAMESGGYDGWTPYEVL